MLSLPRNLYTFGVSRHAGGASLYNGLVIRLKNFTGTPFLVILLKEN